MPVPDMNMEMAYLIDPPHPLATEAECRTFLKDMLELLKEDPGSDTVQHEVERMRRRIRERSWEGVTFKPDSTRRENLNKG